MKILYIVYKEKEQYIDMFTQIKKVEKKYEINDYNGEKINNSNYILKTGKNPILLSAPHAVKQVREGRIKEEDRYTGAIVEILCKTCNCYGIIRNYNAGDDPNKDSLGIGLEYKKKILDIIKENNINLLIDIHGCTNNHGFDFCIGTNNGENLNGNNDIVRKLKRELNSIGKVAIDEIFKACLEQNVSRYVSHNSNIPSIQLEISKKFRNESIGELILVLERYINNMQKEE